MFVAVFSVLQDTKFGFAVNELLDVGIPAREATAAAERLRAVGGVTHVALSSSGPGSGESALASTPDRAATAVSIVEAGNGFFETTGLAIVQGRQFLPDETAGAAVQNRLRGRGIHVVAGENPLGKSLDVTLNGRSTHLL